MVTSSSTVGKIANSSGRLTLNTAMTMTSDSAMLNVNNTSSITGGSGRIIIARIEMRPMGTPMPDAHQRAKAGSELRQRWPWWFMRAVSG